MAELIATPNEQTERTVLPFVNAPRKKWEFEPLRWLGINAGLTLATIADNTEQRHGKESLAAAALQRLMN
jgi:hypothetical protein